ncbi:MAG: serine hydrolase domain-containing protein [Chryseotalea sp.]
MTRQTILTFLLIVFQTHFFAQGQPSNFDKQKVGGEIRHLIQNTNSVGTSVVITNADTIIYFEGFGNADLEKNTLVTEQTLFGVGSITKTFTALAILKLVEAGKLNLSDKVLDLAPELPITNKWEKDFPVRVYHLLEHTSGFDELHPKDKTIPVENDDFPLLDGINIVKNSLKTRWQPGSRHAYSNVGYLVAGYIIEKIAGQSYNIFIKSEVLQPLGMNQSTIKLDEINADLLAKSYSNNRKVRPYEHVFTRPTASIFSSARDMSRFIQLILRNGKTEQETFLNERTIRDLETHHSIKLFQNTENGYRLGIYPRFYNGTKWFGHGGAFNEYKSEFEYSHELQLGIFVVSNGPNATRTVSSILEILHNHLHGKSINKLKDVETGSKNSYNGYYTFISPRHQLMYPFAELFNGGFFIKSKDDKLFISSIDSQDRQLYITGENTFSSSKDKVGYQYIFDPSASSVYTSLGFTYERKSFPLILTLGILLISSIVISLISQLVLVISTLMTFRNKKNRTTKAQILLELSASILLIGIVTFPLSGSMENVHKPNAVSITLFITTACFPILTIIGITYLIRGKFKDRSVINKSYLIGLAISLLFTSLYLCYWDIFAFRIWSY